MTEQSAFVNPPSQATRPSHLSLRSFTIVMILLLAVFTLLNPIWTSTAMSEWDENILWSYVVIPPLAALFLAFEKKLSWSTLFLESMKFTFVKFGITFIVSNALWTYWGAPGTGLPEHVATPTETSHPAFSPLPAPEPTRLDPASLGSIDGRVLNEQGKPIANALVRISSGLEQIVFSPPANKLIMTNDGSGFQPQFAVAQTYQEVALNSSTDGIHTVVMLGDDERLMLNFPVLPDAERSLMFERAHGFTSLTCSVHREDENKATLLIASNPFFAQTNEEGAFQFTDVPAGRIGLSVLSAGSTEFASETQVVAGEESQVTIAPQ